MLSVTSSCHYHDIHNFTRKYYGRENVANFDFAKVWICLWLGIIFLSISYLFEKFRRKSWFKFEFFGVNLSMVHPQNLANVLCL